ncbi:5'-nucleotidase C-terminal domain-containing protein [Streptococcus dentapri]|uniref:5'-nucleotidase C-terminal domain-containing protein n=1 Tax=Streptococcus dentapri TaxID=573564 RepID=A0ABV8D049_9STRE
MRKQTLIIPTLSALLFSTAILSNKAYADEVNSSGNAEMKVDSTQMPVNNQEKAADDALKKSDSLSSSEQSVQADEQVANQETADVEASEASGDFDESSLSAVSASAAASNNINIIHTNDVHGRMVEEDGVIGDAKLATLVNQSRQESETLVFDAGDSFQGLPISNSSQGEDMAEVMNKIGFDAMTVGNHEFDFGLYQLKRLREKLEFPIISSNIYVNGARLFEPSTFIDKNPEITGDEVVVIGVTTPETATKTHPKNIAGVSFTDPITEVNSVIAQIEANARAEGVNYNTYVVLAHLGVDNTTKTEWQGTTLARALSENEELAGKNVIVIDGHSHSILQANYGNVTYSQTGSYLHNVGKITLNSDKLASADLISADEVKDLVPDDSISDLIAAIQEKYRTETAVVVYENSPIELNGDRMNVRVRETNLGNAVADALLEYGQTGFSQKSNLAVTNGGGLRDNIKKDEPITKGEIISVLPFGNTVSQIQVTGQEIYDMFTTSLGSMTQIDNHGHSIVDENGNPLLEPSGGFLQVAGAHVYYDTNLSADKRILAIDIWDPETNSYKDLDKRATYYLVTNDFLAAGGDNYTMLGGFREEGPSMDQVFEDYLVSDVDLMKYEIINPNSRLISVSALEYYNEYWIKNNFDDFVRPFPDKYSNLNPETDADEQKTDLQSGKLVGIAPTALSKELESASDTVETGLKNDLADMKDKTEQSDSSDQSSQTADAGFSDQKETPKFSHSLDGSGANSSAAQPGQAGSSLEANSRPLSTQTDTGADLSNHANEILVSALGVTIVAAGAIFDHFRIRKNNK